MVKNKKMENGEITYMVKLTFHEDEERQVKEVNYPLSKANGLPASQTSQPTISTGVNSGSPYPILLFLCYLS